MGTREEPEVYELHCKQEFKDIKDRQGVLEYKLDRLTQTITGNGKIGLITRVDRQEQKWKTMWILFAPIYAAIIGVVAKAVWSHFSV